MKRNQDFANQQGGTLRQGPSAIIQGMIGCALRAYRLGQPAEAERLCRQVLSIDAHHAGSLNLLGMLAFQTGRYELAAERFQKAISLNRGRATYHSNLGAVLRAQGKLKDAAAWFERALALQPDLAEAHVNLGGVLHAQGRFDDAAAQCQQALALKPDLAEAHMNLGAVLHAQGKLQQALALCGRAAALKPELAEAHHNLGRVLRSLGRSGEALACYGRALALQPNYAQAHFSQSLVQLLQADFSSGWRNYEWRWQSEDHDTPRRVYPQPLWTGEPLHSGRLLIWGEQGVGDEIMFSGLIPDVIRTGNRCTLDCDPRLKPLFVRSFPEVDVISGYRPEQAAEFEIAAHLPIGSLPGLFRPTSAAFASTTSPYLIADPVARNRFRTRYADGRRLAGLAWQTKSPKGGHSRSIDLSLFAPLFALPGIRWISLQYGDHDALQAQPTEAAAPILIDRTVDQLSNIDRFAAQVAAMDLVVTIDNSTAHLAGSLGVPAWVLLPFAADWRWLETREDSPWYPTMRLFRQPEPEDWQSVVERVKAAL